MTNATPHDRPGTAIAFILLGMCAISVNDTIIKYLSSGYPLHQIVFTRSVIAIVLTLIMLHMEGGFAILRTSRPGLHVIRGLMIVTANMCFFTAVSVLTLAETTAIFFTSPLLITLLSIPFLGEKVGPYRIGAVLVGFVGVVIVSRPWASGAERDAPFILYMLPLIGAFAYAVTQLLTRKLGVSSPASALAVYLQVTFIVVSSGFWLVVGDGRYATGQESEALIFLLRAWTWPETTDLWRFGLMGCVTAVVGYSMSQAYRLSNSATVAPFEYVGLPLAIFWGWAVFRNLPDATALLGIALILASGLFVFLRERRLKRNLARGPRAGKPG